MTGNVSWRGINALAENPRPPGTEKLAGQEGRYRVRQGKYRIRYEVRDAEAIVTVVKIGDRKERRCTVECRSSRR